MDLTDILIVVFFGVVAVSTVFYAFLTWRLVLETRMMREVQTEPRVSVRVEQDHTVQSGYELTIRNEGQGVAKSVRFEFEGDPSYFRNSWMGRRPPAVDELTIIKNGLDYLEPNQTYRFPLGSVSPKEFERAVEAPWTFRTHYESLYGKPGTDTYVVDFSQSRGMFFEPNHLEELAEHIKTVREDLHGLIEGHAIVQVVTQTIEEFEQRREA